MVDIREDSSIKNPACHSFTQTTRGTHVAKLNYSSYTGFPRGKLLLFIRQNMIYTIDLQSIPLLMDTIMQWGQVLRKNLRLGKN